MKAAAVLALLVAAVARAHTPAPAEVVASVSAATASGVERVERDGTNPRVLLVRVGPGWFALPREARAAAAARWLAAWRHAVPQGVVAVLDAHDRAVVRFGAGGAVVGVRDGG